MASFDRRWPKYSVKDFAMRHVFAAVALLCMSAPAVVSYAQEAAKADPNGTWKWTTEGRGGAKREMTLKLKLEGDKLTGTLTQPGRGEGAAPTDTAIEEGTFKDGSVAFKITREFQGNKFTTTYTGKIEGDVLKGTVERPGRGGGEATKTEFEAKREKEEPKK
jgi:hypothetical protein